jgi:transcriptional regulator with XRE-family HTH domain
VVGVAEACLSDDERVVALDPPICGEDEEVEADRKHLAVLGDRLPVELDDVAQSLDVVASPEAEPLGADPVLVRASRASLYLLVSPRLEDRRQGDPGLRGDRADLLRRLEDVPPVLRPELGDHPPAPVGIGLVPERDVLLSQSMCLGHRSTVPEEGPSVDYLLCNVDRVVVQTEQEPQTAGELIRFWRTRRGLSQLELSLDANVSTKHLSFVETGRSSPSRQLLVHLAQHLDLPIMERNRLLLAGGFAPPYLELPYDGEVMQPLRQSLERLLEAHEPNPALIVDGLWNLIESNRAASLLWDGVDPELLEPPINMLRLGVHPGGLPRISSMTAACNAPLIHRLKRRSREDADPALAKLIEEVESYLPGEPPAGAATQPVVSLRLQTPLGEVELFTVIATLGAPLDVTAANLAIETFLPMDPESAARLAELSARRSG